MATLEDSCSFESSVLTVTNPSLTSQGVVSSFLESPESRGGEQAPVLDDPVVVVVLVVGVDEDGTVTGIISKDGVVESGDG